MIFLLSALNVISNANSAVVQNIQVFFFSKLSRFSISDLNRPRPDDRWALLGDARQKITETKNNFA